MVHELACIAQENWDISASRGTVLRSQNFPRDGTFWIDNRCCRARRDGVPQKPLLKITSKSRMSSSASLLIHLPVVDRRGRSFTFVLTTSSFSGSSFSAIGCGSIQGAAIFCDASSAREKPHPRLEFRAAFPADGTGGLQPERIQLTNGRWQKVPLAGSIPRRALCASPPASGGWSTITARQEKQRRETCDSAKDDAGNFVEDNAGRRNSGGSAAIASPQRPQVISWLDFSQKSNFKHGCDVANLFYLQASQSARSAAAAPHNLAGRRGRLVAVRSYPANRARMARVGRQRE